MAHLRRYIVEGSGHFPHDMLRYDQSAFESDQDVQLAGPNDNSDWTEDDVRRLRRKIVLIRDTNLTKAPHVDRWRSFGWVVLADQCEGSRDNYTTHLAAAREQQRQFLKAEAQPHPKGLTEFLGIHAVLSETYDLNGIGTVLNTQGADVTYNPPPVGGALEEGKVTGYELVRRLEMAHKRMRTLRLAIENTQAILDRGVLGKMS